MEESTILRKRIETLEFILRPLVYIASYITIDGNKFVNIRGPCVQYQKNAVKQIYKSNGKRKESVYNFPTKTERFRGPINVYYHKSSLYNNKNTKSKLKTIKSWCIFEEEIDPELLSRVDFIKFGVVFKQNSSNFIPMAMDANNIYPQLRNWWKQSWFPQTNIL
jgi:hypothetical protein